MNVFNEVIVLTLLELKLFVYIWLVWLAVLYWPVIDLRFSQRTGCGKKKSVSVCLSTSYSEPQTFPKNKHTHSEVQTVHIHICKYIYIPVCVCVCSCLVTWHWMRRVKVPSMSTTTSEPSSWPWCCCSGQCFCITVWVSPWDVSSSCNVSLSLCRPNTQECHWGSLARNHVGVPGRPGVWSSLREHGARVWQHLRLHLLRLLHISLLFFGKYTQTKAQFPKSDHN